MSEPFFGCRNPGCAEDVTYPADMLAEHPDGGPICEYCWEDDDARYNGAETLPTFGSLPAFVPKHERNLQELAEALEGLLRSYIGLVNSGDCGSWNPENEVEVKAARAALVKAKGQSND